MGMAADDDVGPSLGEPPRQGQLQGVGAGALLGAPVQVDDDHVGGSGGAAYGAEQRPRSRRALARLRAAAALAA